MKNRSTVQASVKKYSHWSCVRPDQAGGSGLVMTTPCAPPVQCSRLLCLRICGVATASACVAMAR